MRILGCDPGAAGALFLIDFARNRALSSDMPTRIEKGKSRIDHAKLAGTLELLGRIDVAVVERVHAMPGQGVSSMFAFGMAFGALVQALVSAEIKVVFVEPAVWSRAMGVSAKEKDASRTVATLRLPQFVEHWPLKKHHGRSDAALMALHHFKRQST